MKLPILILTLGASAVLLSSCGFPVTVRAVGPHGAVSYNDETGLGVELDATSGK